MKTSEILWQDVQHQKLFQIIDEIEHDVYPDLLRKLRDYIDHHFSLEEEYMRVLKYPHLEAHIESHKDFCQNVEDLIGSHCVLNKSIGKDLASYLNKWLTEHVLGIDKDFEKFAITQHKLL